VIAIEKVRLAEDAWNSRDPQKAAPPQRSSGQASSGFINSSISGRWFAGGIDEAFQPDPHGGSRGFGLVGAGHGL
jgi:hypothetical protein